ncbi:hypothetical protein [Nannocystis bainbridge]|uniref:Uncharacterized protein n=1 Tax=Nannocystis bainbridge TaxID=2995303 RepID=A0ABT5DSE6_9BACT|nr:hypothetical protein [Nannocystis bainbridge]MDC0715653.1 hypothetical protein [Nannocystis bainbridge]
MPSLFEALDVLPPTVSLVCGAAVEHAHKPMPEKAKRSRIRMRRAWQKARRPARTRVE